MNMAEAIEPVPVVTPAPTPEPAPAPAATASNSGDGTASDGSAAASPAPADLSPEPSSSALPEWAQRKIDKLTGRVREAQERLAAAGLPPANGQRPAAAPAPAGTPVPQFTQADFDRAVQQELVAKQFTDNCNAAAERGKAAFAGTWDARVGELRKLVDVRDSSSVLAYNTMLAMALDIGNPETILHELGGDLNRTQRILEMHPARMAAELAKIGAKASAPAPDEGALEPAPAPAARSSGAPRPITPVGSRGSQVAQIDPSDPARADQLGPAEWHKRRSAQRPGPVYTRRNARAT